MTCLIHGSQLHIYDASEGIVKRIELLQCLGVDKVPGCISATWNHVRFHQGVSVCVHVRQRHTNCESEEKYWHLNPVLLVKGFETFDPDATLHLKQRPDHQIGSGVDKPLCLAAHSVEDFETWLQVLSFHTQNRRILHGDAGPVSLPPPGALFRRQAFVISHNQT